MTRKQLRYLVYTAAVLTVAALPLHASDPVGIYALVEKVVFEPATGGAQRVQVWGVFAASDGKRGDDYQPAQRGYLYYALKPGQEDVCKREWSDLKSVAGKGQGIGFGRRYQQNGRVRTAAEKPSSPDVYPIGFGIVKMGSEHRQNSIIEELRRMKSSD